MLLVTCYLERYSTDIPLSEAYEEMDFKRWMDPTNHKLGTTKMPHTTKYGIIIGQEDNVFIWGLSETTGQSNDLLGSIFFTSGCIYCPTDVQNWERTAPNDECTVTQV